MAHVESKELALLVLGEVVEDEVAAVIVFCCCEAGLVNDGKADFVSGWCSISDPVACTDGLSNDFDLTAANI